MIANIYNLIDYNFKKFQAFPIKHFHVFQFDTNIILSCFQVSTFINEYLIKIQSFKINVLNFFSCRLSPVKRIPKHA